MHMRMPALLVLSSALALIAQVGGDVPQVLAADSVSSATTSVASTQPVLADGLAGESVQAPGEPRVGTAVVSGHVRYAGVGPGDAGPTSSTGAVPEFTPVYLQWLGGDGFVSPVYTTVTHTSAGEWAFDLPLARDAVGRVHRFDPGRGDTFRVWMDPFTNERGNTVTMLGRPTGGPHGAGAGAQTDSSRDVTISLFEHPGAYMFGERPASGDSPAGTMVKVAGVVWFESDANASAGHRDRGVGDRAARGYAVEFSGLSAAGSREIAVALSRDPRGDQENITRKILLAHPEFITGTATARIGADGRYSLLLPQDTDPQSLYGVVRDVQGNIVEAIGPYSTPRFTRPKEFGSSAPNNPELTDAGWENVNFAVVSWGNVTVEIVGKDSLNRRVVPGENLEVRLTGKLPPFVNTLEWRNDTGALLSTCVIEVINDAASCSLALTSARRGPTFYSVGLVSGSTLVAADSVAVGGTGTVSPPKSSRIHVGFS